MSSLAGKVAWSRYFQSNVRSSTFGACYLPRHMKLNLAKASAVFFALTTAGLLAYTTVAAQANSNTFRVQDIRYDESTGTKLPVPTFPKGWKLISVSNGEKGNSNTLWFQAADGNVYMMSGFTTYGEFIIDKAVGKLNAR